MQAAIPTGATAIAAMAPADTFPALPASSARTGASAVSSPASSTASPVVSKRTSPAVMHTVPRGMVLGAVAASPAVKRTTPSAAEAGRRSRLRSWAWRSRNSPSAVWGKACRTTHSA